MKPLSNFKLIECECIEGKSFEVIPLNLSDVGKLKKQYELIVNEYVRIFCDKQGMEFEGWVGDIIGGVANCNDFYFRFEDIVLDVNTEQPKFSIIDWHDENIEMPQNQINYYSYTKGLRVSDLKN